MIFVLQGPYVVCRSFMSHSAGLRARGTEKNEKDSERMLAQNRRGELRQNVASSVILALALQTRTHWANFFPSAASLRLKAKGYIKVQIICTCMWLWESPTRPLGLYAVCLRDPPHRLTIYVADDSSPWSRARVRWRQASRAMAALLALHQNPGKISLGLRLGASCSFPPFSLHPSLHPRRGNTFRTVFRSSGADFNWGATRMNGRFSQGGKRQAGWETRENGGTAPPLLRVHVWFPPWAFQSRRRLRSLTLT